MAQLQYKHRHDNVARIVHWEIAKQHGLDVKDKWYKQKPEPVTKNGILPSRRIYKEIEARTSDIVLINSEAPEPRGQLPPALCSRGLQGQLCPFLITIELFYHPNNFASDVRNVINESELIVVGPHWSF